MKCPKCQYVRTAGDTCPSYECPKCGVVYSKFDPAIAEREAALREKLATRPKRQQVEPSIDVEIDPLLPGITKSTAQLPVNKIVVAAFLVLLIVAGGKIGLNKWKQVKTIANAHAVVLNVLKDPNSAQWRNENIAADNMTVCGELNAKNSMGGYVGFKRYISNQKSHLVEGSKYGTWALADNKVPVPEYMVYATKAIDDGSMADSVSMDIFGWFWNSNCA